MDPIDYSPDPINFVNQMMVRHKKWLNSRNNSSESLKYMREAVDQVGRGKDFISALIFNASPTNSDEYDPRNDLALLQLYEFWRSENKMRPIEPWDGSRLRPWLPKENNPQVPNLLTGDLQHFHDAWSRFNPGGTSPDPYKWDPLDALGLELEKYFSDIRSHATWSRPTSGGKMRFYRFNELNNIEVAPYSIRFWGFLKWCDNLRRTMLGEKVETFKHDKNSDIAFMDEFNISHFTWHDDVLGNGKCPSIEGQFGLRKRHKYMMNTHGYAIEFLDFHGDLLAEYNKWRGSAGFPQTTDWTPDEHNSAHILKLAFGGPWGLGNSNGDILEIEDYAPELTDPELKAFKTGAELGYYLENCGITWHGMGHVQNCDIRDVYTNNYSIRFFGWHQWIDTLYRRILKDRPKYNKSIPFKDTIPGFCDDKAAFPRLRKPFHGRWTYRSFSDVADPQADARWFVAEMRLNQVPGMDADGRPTEVVVGELDSGHPDYRYRLSGYIDVNNVSYESKPRFYDDRSKLVMMAEGMTEATRGHVYKYVGNYTVPWPEGVEQIETFTGSMIRAARPDDATKEGTVGSFQCVKKELSGEFYYRNDVFVAPEGAKKIRVELWGAGGGGGSDGPGIGGIDGKPGGDSSIAKLDKSLTSSTKVLGELIDEIRLPDKTVFPTKVIPTSKAKIVALAGGGRGGEHGVNKPAKGGKGGIAKHGANNIAGQSGEKGNAAPGFSGKGGDSLKSSNAGLGGRRVGVDKSGEHGLFPGGGGSGGQMAHTPGGGGGGGAYTNIDIDVQGGDVFEINVGIGGAGGDEGFPAGGNGADGLVRIRIIA